MISRLNAVAAVFAILATASLAFAADLRLGAPATAEVSTPAKVVQLERVVVRAQRLLARTR